MSRRFLVLGVCLLFLGLQVAPARSAETSTRPGGAQQVGSQCTRCPGCGRLYSAYCPCCPYCGTRAPAAAAAPEEAAPLAPSPFKEEPIAPEVGPTEAGPPAGTVAAAPTSVAPYMIGDLLRADRLIQFNYHRAGDIAGTNAADVEAGGFTSFRNTKVAENNNAIPQNRAYFRYNFFANAIDVGGISSTVIPSEPGAPVTERLAPEIRSYDAQLYTLGIERTFCDRMLSIEARIPFATALASDLNLEAGRIEAINPDDTLTVTGTPEATFGGRDTAIDDISFILKALLYCDPCCRRYLSAGLQVTAPTASDVNVRVVDYYGYVLEPISGVRERLFHLDNETWALSPFVAYTSMPTPRLFVNAFFQVDFPVGQSGVQIQETWEQAYEGELVFDQGSDVACDISDQTLLHLDVGCGYWLYRNPCPSLVKGVAGLLELHYTSTLNDGDLVLGDYNDMYQQTKWTGAGIPPEPVPTVGNGVSDLAWPDYGTPYAFNGANRIDIFNLTAGLYFELGRSSNLLVGSVVPLRNLFDRTFDAELAVYYNFMR